MVEPDSTVDLARRLFLYDRRTSDLVYVVPPNTRPDIQTNKLSGVLGVHRYRNKWAAHILVNNKLIRAGVFDSIAQASAAYLEFKRKLHPGSVL